MNRASDLIRTLKNLLRSRGMTYGQLAENLEVSEVTIKRVFSKESFSFHRLEQICQALDMDVFDLVMLAKKENQERGNVLTYDQEYKLAQDPRLFGFFLLLLNGWPLDSIRESFDFSEEQVSGALLKLDRLGLLELHANNRFRMLVKNNVHWKNQGPLWVKYQSEFLEESLGYPFDTKDDRLSFCPALISEASISTVISRLDALFREFNELAELDSNIPHNNRRSVALLFAFRPWTTSSVRDLIKRPRTVKDFDE